jgi:hypothetical protein
MAKLITPARAGVFSFGENRDCTVRALANSTGLLYGNAHNILKRHGRTDKRGCTHYVWHDAYISNGMSLVGVYGTTHGARSLARKLSVVAQDGITLGRMLPTLKQGSYIVIITGHALAVVDGGVVDMNLNRSNSRVIAVYKHS